MSRNNPDDELQPLTAFLPGLDLGAGLRAPDKKTGAGKRPRATITPNRARLIEAAAADQGERGIRVLAPVIGVRRKKDTEAEKDIRAVKRLCPAGRASCAEGGHFVTRISLRWSSRWSE